MTARPRFYIPGDVIVSELDSLLPYPGLLASTKDKHYQVNGTARDILLCLRGRQLMPEEILARLNERETRCDDGKMGECLRQLVRLKVLSFTTSPERPATRKCRISFSHKYLSIRLDLLSPELLLPVTRQLARLMVPQLLLWLSPVLLCVQIVFCIKHFHPLALTLRQQHGTALAIILIGNYAGLLLHELGHAAACVSCGIRHGPIGVCLYLIFPAFYTEVGQAWRLPRFQRMVVDAGGIWFSLLSATIATALYAFTGMPCFGILAILYDVTVLWNLNPFIRMDGYWLVSDLLGIQNLMAANIDLTFWLAKKLTRANNVAPVVVSEEYRYRQWYGLYYVLSMTFFCYGGFRLLTLYLPHFFHTYPVLVNHVTSSFSQEQFSPHTGRLFMSLITNSIPPVALLILVVRGARKALRRFFSGDSMTSPGQGRPWDASDEMIPADSVGSAHQFENRHKEYEYASYRRYSEQ